MAKKSEKEVLEVGVNVEKALQDMTKMERATKRNFSEVAKAVDKLNGVNKRATKDAEEGNDRWQTSLEDLTKAYKAEGKALEDVMNNIDLLTKKAAKQSGAERKATLEDIALLKKKGATQIKALRGKEGKEGKVMASGMFKDASKELGTALKDTLSAVFVSKDVKSALENSAKSLVKGLKLSAAGGLKLSQAGSGLMSKGRDRGGLSGMAMKGGGAAMKTMGSLMGGIKPLIETLTKIGPILGSIGSAVLGIVKLFLDADSMVKDFNKDILEGASTTEFLGAAGGDVNTAFTELGDTLTGIRKAAQSFDNIDWGISPDQYKAIIGTLKQEGVSLHSIKKQAEDAGESVQAFTTDLAHVSVAYSRAFGVPLQEINTLQAEMMTSMGISLKETENSFQQMNKAASESSISANKFFGMIRGVSQDLSMWGTRMEDAVKILGRLGKVMDPRNAQKFLQTAVQGLKNMGRADRLRTTQLAGDPSKIINRDVSRKADSLGTTLGMSGDKVLEKMKEGPAALEDAVSKLPQEMQSSTRDAITRLIMMQKSAGKGAFGKSSAAGDLSAGGALQVLKNALTRLSPGKKLADIVGTIAGEMMAENQGISEDQLKQMAQFEMSLDSQRDMLKKLLTTGNADQRKSAREQLKRAKITGKDDKELISQLDNMDADQILDTMSEDQAKAAKGVADVRDFAHEQTDLQTSMSTKLQMILDWLTNQLYDVLSSILDTILSFPGLGETKRRAGLGSMDLRNAVSASDPNKALVESQSWKDLMAGLKAAKDDPTKADKVSDAVSAMADKIGPEAIAKALKDAGLSDAQLATYQKNAGYSSYVNDTSGGTTDSYANKASEGLKGLSSEDLVKVMEKAVWYGDKMNRAEGITAGKKALGIGPSATPISSTAPIAAPQKPPGGGPAATPTAPAAPPEVKEQASAAQDSLSVSKDQAATMASIDNQMDKFKMDTSFLSGPYSKAIESSVLKSVRTALFEYYMYKDINQKTMVNTMASGGYTQSTIGAAITQGAMGSKQTGPQAITSLTGHATGGVVTGVNNGMAMVTSAAGEGLASVGKGEQIVPAGKGGGGSGPINVTVNGVGGDDLARIIQAKVIDGIHEYKRKERFH